MEPDFLGSPPTFDRCNMYDIDYHNINQLLIKSSSNNLFNNSTLTTNQWKRIKCQNGWEYDLNQTRYSTIVSEVQATSFIIITY